MQQKAGRPMNQVQYNAFLQTCAVLETRDEEQLSISDLIDNMDIILSDTAFTTYHPRTKKEKLVEHYGVDLTISGGTGKKDIFTYLSKFHPFFVITMRSQKM